MTTKIRILCLHGHRHNSAIMDINMEPLRRAFGDSAEFVHVNGVALAQGEPDAIVRRMHIDKEPFYEWFDVRRLEEDEDQSEEYFFQYEGLDDAIMYMDEQLQKLGPFDAVLGFSQGAVLMTVLSMYYVHKKQTPFWWKLCISVCGWRVRDYTWHFLFGGDAGEKMLVLLPSIHIAGKKDPLHCEPKELEFMYAGDATGSAAGGGVTKLFLEVDEGHAFPSGDKYTVFYQELAESIRAACSDTKAPQQQQHVHARL